MYKAIVDFADLQDKEHIYRVGDIFPRPNVDVSDERIKELSTGLNKLGRPLIAEIPSEVVADAPKSVLNTSDDKNIIPEDKTSKKGSDDVDPKRSRRAVDDTVNKKTRPRRKRNAD